jgi:hypothetical protein
MEGFTHTHNIVLNLFVELGVPIAMVVCALLLYALCTAVRRTLSTRDTALRSVRYSALALIGVIAVHSMLEYPLWYAYFLLPTAFLLGLCLDNGPAERTSPLFGHYADYAAATGAAEPASAMRAFAYATRHVLDPELMIAWARAFEATGQTDKARYLAMRLRELDGSEAHPFFAPCKHSITSSSDVPMPFQCAAPARPMRYEEFK